MKKKILTLTVSKEWFDKIVSGEKTEEYRTIKDYWTVRLYDVFAKNPTKYLKDKKISGDIDYIKLMIRCNHFVRHVHAQPFVSTSRPDITGSKVSRHDMRQDELVNLQLSLNAQEIINISKLRLCSKAARETREIWYKVLDELVRIEPYLASACVPLCIYRGCCPEQKSCGRTTYSSYEIIRREYKKLNLLCVDSI